ncbi:MAG: tetratricopeptide repeat protein [Planctomycetes bacterium]|nr:tetratricopeptide repeat protein [Planctomycetota bacterium]
MADRRAHTGPAAERGDPVEQLVFECLERIETEGEAAVDALCAEHPEHAEELRRSLRTLRGLGVPAGPVGVPERLGGFRLLERIGEGGMGLVHLAEDERLGRKVALKLIRPENLLFRSSRERFQREVLAVARLQHPGIVPVYAVGEDQGIPFFAMQWIQGRSLATALAAVADRVPETLTARDLCPGATADADSPLGTGWVEACLRITMGTAEALQHAHERGILHRDVKPSNIMLAADGRPLLVDFGLAAAEGDSRLTRSGAAAGSPLYMSPEQIRGDRLDARTDVYSLGVTLYELLTLRCPFAGPTAEATRERILAGRPHSIRAVDRAVSWEAETVCLTAMDPDPERRYATAAAFAHDLANVLALRPIRARRPGAWLRARRFAQRHPAGTVAALLGFLLFCVAPTIAWLRIRAEIRRTVAAQQDAERRATTAQRVVGLLEGLFEASDPFGSEPRDVSARELLERGLPQVTAGLEGEPEVRATLLGAVGRVSRELGAYERARPLLLEALALRRSQPGTAVRDLGQSLIDLAGLHETLGEHAEAVALAREAIALLTPLGPSAAPQLAAAGCGLTIALRQLGDLEGSAEAGRRAVAIARGIEPGPAATLGNCLTALGITLVHSGADAAAEPLLREALATEERRLGPDHPAIAHQLTALAALLAARGALGEAQACHERALEIAHAHLEADHPWIARCLANIAMLHAMRGELPVAIERFRESLAALRAHFGESHTDIATTSMNLANALAQSGEFGEAETLFRAAIRLYGELVGEDHPNRAVALNCLAALLVQTGRPTEAVETATEALAILRSAGLPYAADSLAVLGEAQQALGDAPAAAATLAEALAGLRTICSPAQAEVLRVTAQLAALRAQLGDVAGARELLQAAIEAARTAGGAPDGAIEDLESALAELHDDGI